jgi:O-antigen/teichoic acid export membrane protein
MSVSHTTGRRAAGDVTLQVVARVLNLALGVVVTAVLVRTLGDAGYGEWSTLLVAIQLAGYFTTFGLQGVVLRESAADPDREPEWVGALLVLRALLSVPALIAGLVIVVALHSDRTMLVAGLILLAGFPLGIGASLQVVHQLRVRNFWPMLVLTVNSVVWGALVFILHVTGGGLIAFAIAMTAVSALSAGLQAAGALRIMRPRRPSRRALAHVLRVGVPVGVAGMLTLAYARIDGLIVFELAGSRDAGLYSAVYRMLDQAHFVPVSIMTTLAPIIAASWPAHPERLLHVTRRAAEFLCMASLGGLVFALVAAEPVTRLLFGEEFVAAAPALPVLGGAFVFICFGYLTGNLLLVTGQQRTLVTAGLIGLAVNVVANLLLVPSGGFMAAAWVTLATEGFVVIYSAFVVRGSRGLALGMPPLGRLPQIAAAAAGLAVALVAVDRAGGSLAVLAVVAATVYPGLLFGLRALRPGELRALVTRSPATV